MTEKAKILGGAYIEFDGYEPNGLTKREYFAAMAMQGMIASEQENWSYGDVENIAKEAVMRANALLEELAKDMEDFKD